MPSMEIIRQMTTCLAKVIGADANFKRRKWVERQLSINRKFQNRGLQRLNGGIVKFTDDRKAS